MTVMRKILALSALAAGTLAAQTAAITRSVSGVVKDKTTGRPLPNYTVSTEVNATWVGNTIVTSRSTKEVTSGTDSAGRYKLDGLPPGTYRITIREPRRGGLTRHVTVSGGDLENIDFLVTLDGMITGKVVDENKEPVPDMWVRLITREYYLGNLGYHFSTASTRTNDRGEYTLTLVQAGRPYMIMVDKFDLHLPIHSEVPLDPKLRKRVPVRTWYPNSPNREGAEPVTLRPGERREGVDIEVRKSPSYCVDGTAEGPGGVGSLLLSLEATQPASGISAGGGTFFAPQSGSTAADGKFRICDLYPGGYRLSALAIDPKPQGLQNYGVTEIAITDRDLHDVTVLAMPGKPLDGEVVWDADAPTDAAADQATPKVSISLNPLYRAGYRNEHADARPEIPGTFTLDSVFPDDYALRAFLNAPGLYVKDVTYSNRSVLYEPLRMGSALAGAGLRVVIARDGARLSVKAADKDGNPVADLKVLAMPKEVASEGMLAAQLVQGQTDQLGQYTSQTLPPGKYYVLATEDSVDATPESMDKLWRARNRFQEVELPPSGSAQVKLQPGKIE